MRSMSIDSDFSRIAFKTVRRREYSDAGLDRAMQFASTLPPPESAAVDVQPELELFEIGEL